MSQQAAKRALKNSVFLFVRMVIVLLIGLYTSRVILRELGFDNFGIYNVVGSVVIFFSFLNAALTNATSRYLTFELGTGNIENLRRTYTMAIKAHIILAAALFIALEIAGVWFVNNKLNIDADRINAANWCFQFSLLTFVMKVIRVPFNSNIIAHEKMNFFAVISVAEKLLQLGIVFMLSVSELDKLIFYSFLLLVVSVVVFVAYYVYCRKNFHDCIVIRYWDFSIIKKFASYSGYSMLVNGADGIGLQCRSIFFNWFVGTLANAALGVANQVITLMNTFVDNFSKAIQPQIIKSYASGDRQYFMAILYSASKLNYCLFISICIPVILNLDFILTLWLDKYPSLTVPFVKAIIIYMIFDTIQYPFVLAVHATGNLKTHQIMIASIKILSIPATYLVLYLGYSPVVALYFWAGLNIICSVARTIYMKRLIGLFIGRYVKDVVFRIFIVTILAIPFPYYLSKTLAGDWQKLIITTAVSIITIGLSSFFIGLNKREKEFVINLIPIKFFNKKVVKNV